ncbi:Lipid-A-disaccharide synthase [Thiorhodovibrio winogradskyi]|uniref:Lipid-A-disaccharide synthase n=1 Tax=Thiorhodovibrio winogradskyi TaxID=77007 RepID=A0ABZ0SBW1_9GAMM|nr:lipid-A-disaccharide synthase [Thiorhodovibrio winogradskyi]
MPVTIALVANEPSGDQLGALVLRALRARCPDARFVGVAGPKMIAEGCETWLPLEQLSVMGFVEVLKELPRLLRLRRELRARVLALQPDLFVGIDAPDFNLGLERDLRAAGIPTAHLVCPTVWAWRPGRVKAIRRAVDLMLSIFPFEEEFLRRHRVPVRYIGHPLADDIPFDVDQAQARAAIGLPATELPAIASVVALLPGSRLSEVERLADPFIETALQCQSERPDLRFVVPLVSQRIRAVFESRLRQLGQGRLRPLLLDGRSREAIAAADIVLTASGTATLETLLLKRPMLVAYRLNPLTWALLKGLRLIKVPYAAMANLLVGRELAAEFLQERCNASAMAPMLLRLLDDAALREEIQAAYQRVHRRLRQDAAARAADALLALIKAPGSV